MTFDPNIPTIPSSPNTSASPVQVNFSQFASIFSNTLGGVVYNHFPLTGNSKQQGKHGAVIMEKQTADPGVTGDYSVLYNKNATSALNTQPQLFSQILPFLPNSRDTTQAENTPIQLTYNSVGLSAPFYSFLPGGYLFYFGSTNNIAVPIVLSPTPTKILCALAFPTATGGANRPLPIQFNVPFDSLVTVTQPDTFLISSARATPGAVFLYLAIAKA